MFADVTEMGSLPTPAKEVIQKNNPTIVDQKNSKTLRTFRSKIPLGKFIRIKLWGHGAINGKVKKSRIEMLTVDFDRLNLKKK